MAENGNQITALAKAVLDAETDWRFRGAEGRRSAYERFERLLHAIADLTERPYEEVYNDAIEEWVTSHFCSVPSSTPR
ncbi:MAG: hypothetical protein ACXVQY_03645 [Actinomycetota bacterium]